MVSVSEPLRLLEPPTEMAGSVEVPTNLWYNTTGAVHATSKSEEFAVKQPNRSI